jgi:hypothetical protein
MNLTSVRTRGAGLVGAALIAGLVGAVVAFLADFIKTKGDVVV